MRHLAGVAKEFTFHIFLSLNSSTRASSGVMVAHCRMTFRHGQSLAFILVQLKNRSAAESPS